MNEFETLLQDFEKIPKIKEVVPTIMEIAGFPHYENVCSNILAYYFETKNPHGMKNLLLKSLLECLDSDLSERFIETSVVRREEPTSNKKRIDIIIEADDFVIAIENKIYAGMYNDLEEYSRHIDERYVSKIKKMKIVLSMKREFNYEHPSGFLNVTYDEFINRIKLNFGEYILLSDSKSTIFLFDFLLTILNLSKTETMNQAVLDFFNQNRQSIESLIEEKNNLQSHLANKVNQLKSLVPPQALNVTQWVYRKYDLVHDFDFDGVIVAVDCVFDFDGIEILVWLRKGDVNNYEFLKELQLYRNSPFLQSDFHNNRITVVPKQSLPVLTPLESIAEKLNDVLRSIKF